MIRLILDTERRIFSNYWRVLGDGRRIGYILLSLLVLLFFVPFVGIVLFSITTSVDKVNIDTYLLLLTLASGIVIILLSIHFIIKDVILNGHIALYLTYPISSGELFWAKFIKHNALYATSILLPLSIIVGAALALRDHQWLLVISSIAYFIALGIIFTSVSFSVVFLTANALPIKKVSNTLSFLGGLSFLLIYVVLFATNDALSNVFSSFPEVPVSYSGFLYDYTILIGIIVPCLLLVLALGAVIATRFIVVKSVDRIGIIEGHSSKSSKARRDKIRNPVHMLVVKDIKLSYRNPRELAALLPIFMLPLVLVYISSTTEEGTLSLIVEGSQLLATAAGGALITGLYISAHHTARDAEHFHFLDILPVSGRLIACSKYVFNFLVTAPFLMVIFTGVWYFSTASVNMLLYVLLCIVLVCVVATPLGMLIGSANPVVSRKNPSKRLDILSNVIIGFTIFFVYMLVSALSNFLADMDAMGQGGLRNGTMLVIGFLIVCVATSWFVLIKVARRYDVGFNITYKD
ncbi:hypothetical protein ACFOU0_06305 [Salinicoccus sesuvii]|uniref:ABC-2 type transport system permease protein n=1 Tax=Salinicoccus sesuvii TaxID=868281 RepID=A0ABV7N5P8_9STAP